MPDWIERPVHQALYSLERSIAQLTWGFDRSALYVIDLLDRFRHGLVTQGFTTALDTVATTMVGVSRPVFELALVTGCLLIIASPLIRLQWVNLRKAMVLALVIPLLLPLIAATFQDIDAARGDMADAFYNQIFAQAHFDLGGDGGGNGAPVDMGPVVPYGGRSDGRTGLRGVDVAAAYLYATRDDVTENRDLPTAFAQRYFALTVEDLAAVDGAQRWVEIQEGANGITRTLYGVILLAFAFFEAVTTLGFTIALGFLLLALLIASAFAFFTPFEGLWVGIMKKLAELFLQSWAISALQALLLAAVIQVAATSGGTATLGIGVIALFLQAMFTIVAYKTVLGSVTGLGMGSGAGLSTFEAGRMLGPARALAGGAIAGAAAGAIGSAVAAPKAALAYASARRAGASSAFARGYALHASRPLAAVGALASAMGAGGAEFRAGGAQARMARHRGQGVLSPLGLHGVAQHAERQQAQQRAAARDQTQAQDAAAARAERTRNSAERARVAPIQAITRSQIADQVATAYAAAHMAQPGRAAPVDAVTAGLGLAPGAFGRASPAVQTVLDDLAATPFAPDLAARMLRETSQTGTLAAATRMEAAQDLVASGMSPAAAAARVTAMQTTMAQLPTQIAVPDALDAAAAQATPLPFAGYSAAHRPRPQPAAHPSDLARVRRPPPTLRGGPRRARPLPPP